MNSAMGSAMMIVWAECGLIIDNMIEEPEQLTVYVSVPETSYHKNVNCEIMAGQFLAKRFKETLTSLGVKRLVVKSKVRKGDIWTEQKAQDAALQMKKTIYGSQY